MSQDFYTTTDAFKEKFIELVKTTYPTLPIIEANQNVTQPVNIIGGESLMTFDIEQIIKTGTDYRIGLDSVTDTFVYGGDRQVRLIIELFDPQALTNLTQLRDIWETEEYQELMLNLGMMEERQNSSPRTSTRKHSKEKYVVSARYVTNFNMGIFFTQTGVVLGSIEHVVINNGL